MSSSLAVTLGRVEDQIDSAYKAVKAARIALGDAPISLGTTAIGGLLGLFTNTSNQTVKAVAADVGLMSDGLLRGLFYKGGILHGPAARKVPWLVTSRAAPAGWGGVAAALKTGATLMRGSLLAISGALGVIRASKAVSEYGPHALYRTKAGRSGVLQAVGSALLIVPHPAARLSAAGLFAAEIVNELV